jgi:hypothetical protein
MSKIKTCKFGSIKWFWPIIFARVFAQDACDEPAIDWLDSLIGLRAFAISSFPLTFNPSFNFMGGVEKVNN